MPIKDINGEVIGVAQVIRSRISFYFHISTNENQKNVFFIRSIGQISRF